MLALSVNLNPKKQRTGAAADIPVILARHAHAGRGLATQRDAELSKAQPGSTSREGPPPLHRPYARAA